MKGSPKRTRGANVPTSLFPQREMVNGASVVQTDKAPLPSSPCCPTWAPAPQLSTVKMLVSDIVWQLEKSHGLLNSMAMRTVSALSTAKASMTWHRWPSEFSSLALEQVFE